MRKLSILFVLSFLATILFPHIVLATGDKALLPTGKGIKVAIIDSGIDPSHPEFVGKKNIHGYDFVSKKKRLTDAWGHGTHVTGIVLQIAPDVSIYSYRVLDNKGGGTTEDLIKALKAAIKKNVDIINLSLGNEISDKEIMGVIRSASQKGILVVTAAGNEGPEPGSILCPATSPDVLTVGAMTRKVVVPAIRVGDHDEPFELLPLEDSPSFPWEASFRVVDIGTGEKEDDYVGVAGKVVLVKRSNLSPREISERAHTYGAAAVLIYNRKKGEYNSENPICFLGADCPIPTATIAGEYGVYVKKKMKSEKVVLHFTVLPKERVSASSSRGPVMDTGVLKPDIVAPGTDVRSCVPLSLDKTGYREMSGTSQAAAYVSGVAALLKQQQPKWSSEEIKAALVTTAEPLTNTLHKTVPFTEQGAGKVDIGKALSMKTLAIPSSLSFGTMYSSSGMKRFVKTVNLKNCSNHLKRYQLSGNMLSHRRGIEITVPAAVEIPAKGEISLEIVMQLECQKLRKGAHMGVIWMKGETSEEMLHVPFLIVKKK